jgi:hypothetical protein
MSFLDEIKQRALDVLHATTNAIHAQFAASLMQAGHDVTPDDHVDTLVNTALTASAATGKPTGTVAPNYADHALATFSTSMTSALMQFASTFLPAKFQPAADAAQAAVSNALADGKVTAGEAVDAALKVGAAVATAVSPAAAAAVALATPIVESLAEGGASSTAAPVVQAAAAAGEQAVDEGINAAAQAVTDAAAKVVASAFGKLGGGL